MPPEKFLKAIYEEPVYSFSAFSKIVHRQTANAPREVSVVVTGTGDRRAQGKVIDRIAFWGDAIHRPLPNRSRRSPRVFCSCRR